MLDVAKSIRSLPLGLALAAGCAALVAAGPAAAQIPAQVALVKSIAAAQVASEDAGPVIDDSVPDPFDPLAVISMGT